MKILLSLALLGSALTSLAAPAKTSTIDFSGYTQTVFQINTLLDDYNYTLVRYPAMTYNRWFYFGQEQQCWYRVTGDSTEPITWSNYFQLANNEWSNSFYMTNYFMEGDVVVLYCHHQSQRGKETWRRDSDSLTFSRNMESEIFEDLNYRVESEY